MKNYELSRAEYRELLKSLKGVENYKDILWGFASCVAYMMGNDRDFEELDVKTRNLIVDKIFALKNDLIEDIENC